MKVGQHPPLKHVPPKELARRLDEQDQDFYVKALDCRNFNYGLGAIAYMRRVVENKTNDLLDLMVEALRADGAPEAKLAEIEAVRQGVVYDAKLDVAQKLLPARLVRDGSNPIKSIHNLTSEALHEKSEEECIDVFDRARAAFEYVFAELEVEKLRAEEYTKTIRDLDKQVSKSVQPSKVIGKTPE